MSPVVHCSKPAMSRRVVVFPHPEGPSSEKKFPGGTASEISATARWPGKSLTKLRTSRIGVMDLLCACLFVSEVVLLANIVAFQGKNQAIVRFGCPRRDNPVVGQSAGFVVISSHGH